jgi:hypothetical protein
MKEINEKISKEVKCVDRLFFQSQGSTPGPYALIQDKCCTTELPPQPSNMFKNIFPNGEALDKPKLKGILQKT